MVITQPLSRLKLLEKQGVSITDCTGYGMDLVPAQLLKCMPQSYIRMLGLVAGVTACGGEGRLLPESDWHRGRKPKTGAVVAPHV